MANFLYVLEVLVLESLCLGLCALMLSLFLSYRCTPLSRCSPVKMRITQICALALALLVIRCLDPNTRLRLIPFHVQAIFSDQITALLAHAAMVVLLASAKSLYTMLRVPMPPSLRWLIFVPALLYQLVALAVGLAMIWVLPDALSTKPTSRVSNVQATRILNFQCLMLFVCAASWACVIGLRKQVAIYVRTIERQEADRATNTAATLAASAVTAATAVALATAEPAATVSSPSHAGMLVAPAPPAAASLRVAVIPSALTVGGSISVPAPSASSVAGPSGNGRGPTASTVVSSAASHASAAAARLADLKIAAKKLRTLFILIQCVIWSGFLTNLSFLSYYLSGRIDPYYTDTDFNDNERYDLSLAALPLYACGHVAGVYVLLWYVWVDSAAWRRHLREDGIVELAALVWRGAQEDGHTNQTRQSQPTAAAPTAGAGDRRVHPAPAPGRITSLLPSGVKPAWSKPEVSTAPAQSSQQRPQRRTGEGRHSGNPYLCTSPTNANHSTLHGEAGSTAAAALSSPVDGGLADIGACSPDGADDAVVLLYPSSAIAPRGSSANDGFDEA